MRQNLANAFYKNFLGTAPVWYKFTILSFLIINPLVFLLNPFVAGWLLIVEFIFTLVMALKCYPLPAGGLLVIQAVAIGMTTPAAVLAEIENNLQVVLLLMFMIAGIYFMREGIAFVFTKIIIKIKSKVVLSLAFCLTAAALSAFLDALTVVAVLMSVIYSCYSVYMKVTSVEEDATPDSSGIKEAYKDDVVQFKGFLRNIMMHAAVGTAMGGAMTLVGEPQNLFIGEMMGWSFRDFFIMCSPVSIPVFITGIVTCVFLENVKLFGYGYKMPESARRILEEDTIKTMRNMDKSTVLKLVIQALTGILLILSLAFNLAAVGLIGLMIIILLSAFTGQVNEHDFGPAFAEGLPFTALLVVFFAIIAVVNDLNLFGGMISAVLSMGEHGQLLTMFSAAGLLSMISDNVFVAGIYITEITKAYNAGVFGPEWYNKLAVVVNMGTNIPAVATPNGQAAFLFLLTSSLSPLIKLSYMEMVKLALPYTIFLTSAGLLATYFL